MNPLWALLVADGAETSTRVEPPREALLHDTRGAASFNEIPDIGEPYLDPPRWESIEHLHEGRLLHRYAVGPRHANHRICRGRP